MSFRRENYSDTSITGILSSYFAFVLGIGLWMRRRVKCSEGFPTSHRSVPVWITSLAFIAANLGAQEVVGPCDSNVKYGLMTAHFYWLGAVRTMIVVGVCMMPSTMPRSEHAGNINAKRTRRAY